MQFVILLDDGTEIKGREFEKVEAIPSIAEEIVYTNNNFFHKDRFVVGLYIKEINKFFKVEYLNKEFKTFRIKECSKEVFDNKGELKW